MSILGDTGEKKQSVRSLKIVLYYQMVCDLLQQSEGFLPMLALLTWTYGSRCTRSVAAIFVVLQ